MKDGRYVENEVIKIKSGKVHAGKVARFHQYIPAKSGAETKCIVKYRSEVGPMKMLTTTLDNIEPVTLNEA